MNAFFDVLLYIILKPIVWVSEYLFRVLFQHSWCAADFAVLYFVYYMKWDYTNWQTYVTVFVGWILTAMGKQLLDRLDGK